MKTAVFWDDKPCSMLEIDRGFRGAMIEAKVGPFVHGATFRTKVIFMAKQFPLTAITYACL
jgi:hypothetical protein